MNADETLIRGGYILTMDPAVPDLQQGDVLIEGGRITAIGPDIATDDAAIIDATGKIVMPGLIDAHTHLWQTPIRGLASDCWGEEYFTTIHPVSQNVGPSDMWTATYAGALELLASGVTTVVDFCHSIHSPEHPRASLDAFERAGIRALFGYSLRDRPEMQTRSLRSTQDRMDDLRQLHAARAADEGLVRLVVALNNIEHVSDEDGAAEIEFAREVGLPMMVHSVQPQAIANLQRRSLLGPDIQWVHATGASDVELAMLAAEAGSIAITPEAEAATLGVWPVTGRALRAGVPSGLGMDLVSAVGGSILNQVRSAVILGRLEVAHLRRIQGHPPVRDGHLQPLDAARGLQLATADAATSIWLGDTTGTLTPGKAADIVIMSIPAFARPATDIATHVAMQGSRAEVDTVLVDGTVRVRDGALVDVDLEQLAADMDTARANLMPS